MGYCGLDTYNSSDMAWDFHACLEEAKEQNQDIVSLIIEELKNEANCYNTDGVTNIALCLEDGIITTSEIPDDIFETIKSKLNEKILNCSKKNAWGEDSESSRKMHLKAFTRMLKFIG